MPHYKLHTMFDGGYCSGFRAYFLCNGFVFPLVRHWRIRSEKSFKGRCLMSFEKGEGSIERFCCGEGFMDAPANTEVLRTNARVKLHHNTCHKNILATSDLCHVKEARDHCRHVTACEGVGLSHTEHVVDTNLVACFVHLQGNPVLHCCQTILERFTVGIPCDVECDLPIPIVAQIGY